MARMPNRSDLEAAVDAAVELGKAQARALTALPGAITAIAEAAQNINATANEARAVIRKAQAVTDRLDSMLDHVEPAVSELTPTLQALKEAQQRIVAMTGSTEKMASFVEDAGAGLSRLAGISGASGLFNRIAAATKPAETPRTLAAVRGELRAPDAPVDEELLAEVVPDHAVAASEAVDPAVEDAVLVDQDAAADEPAADAAQGSDGSAASTASRTSTAPPSADGDAAPAYAGEPAEAPIFEALAEDLPVDLPEHDETETSVPVSEAQVDAALPVDLPEHDDTETSVPVSDAQVDAALQPVELGSEADGPDTADGADGVAGPDGADGADGDRT